jgi:hypothetical protein
MHFSNYVDYVGADNDDVLRLVRCAISCPVRAGLISPSRLGLEGGTLMHWSTTHRPSDRKPDLDVLAGHGSGHGRGNGAVCLAADHATARLLRTAIGRQTLAGAFRAA